MSAMDSLFGLLFGRRNPPASSDAPPSTTPAPAPAAEPRVAPRADTSTTTTSDAPVAPASTPAPEPTPPPASTPEPATPEPTPAAAEVAPTTTEAVTPTTPEPAPAPAPEPIPIPIPAPIAPAPSENGLRPGYLSPHFTLAEMTASSTAMRQNIDNRASPEIVERLRHAAQHMERVREVLGHPITVTSGYRCLQLNRAIGSTDTSAHVKGYAVDFRCPGFGTPFDVAKKLAESPVLDHCDQIIHEFGEWVHISFDPNSSVKAINKVITIHKLHDGRKVTAGIVALNNGTPV